MQLVRAIIPALMIPLPVAAAACWQEEDERKVATPEPTVDLSTLTLEDVYSRLAEAITRPGIGTSPGEDQFSFETGIYLDEATFLPLAITAHRVELGERGQSFDLTMRFDSEFVPTDSLPPDFFDPASIGYVYQDPAEPLGKLDPSLTVYWLGREFPGQGQLPRLALSQVESPKQRSWPSYEAILHYRLPDEPFGPPSLSLQEWRLEEWQAFLAQARGGNWWDSPCVQREQQAIEGGSAAIFKGYNEMPLPLPVPSGTPVLPENVTRPATPPDRFIAHAYLPSTFILVDAPGVAGPHPAESPYNSLEGMEAVLRGLRPRE